MNAPHTPDDDLRRLLHDAVDHVEPGNGLDAIRARTKETTMSARPWIFGVGGAVLATAATITAVALVGNVGNPSADDPGVANTPNGQVSESADATSEPSPTPTETDSAPPSGEAAVPVYWVGDTPQGLRLYREFQRDAVAGEPLVAAVTTAVEGSPDDPDYRSGWPEGAGVAGASYDGDLITVDLSGDLRDRPAGMSEDQAAIAVEQLIYTAQAAVGEGRLPVQLLIDGERTDQVLGIPASEPLANGDQLSTLALVNITSPAEGETVSGSIEASGVASSFEATVPIEIRRGDEVVVSTFATAEGFMDRLYPWTTTVDISKLAPGEYTFVAMTSDPSGGAEGAGPHVDTRTIIVE